MIIKAKYTVGDLAITELAVNTINFITFTKIASASVDAEITEQHKKLFRARVKAQVTAKVTGQNDPVAMTDAMISKLPIHAAFKLKDAINEVMFAEGQPEAKLLEAGDGIITPIRLQLSAPIAMQNGKTIPELEFRADTFEQLEETILGETPLDQVLGLLKIAKPISPDFELQALPSWAIDQLSFTDGMFITSSILPSFTQGQPDL